jgi:branched-chain amino acid transport system ATP-binding protein
VVAPLLELKGLSRRFGGLHAVRDLAFEVAEGSIAGLIGPNGAGKTTAFILIAGSLTPDGGTVLYRGLPIIGLGPAAVASLGIARTFQTTRLFPHMTVLENVMIGRHIRSRSGFLSAMLQLPRTWTEERGIRERAMEVLGKLGLDALAPVRAGILPFGKGRLVEFARALAMEPSLILLDEPAAGLNIYETGELGGLIRKIREWGVTVLLVEHDMSLVMEICDAIVVLDHGGKIAEGTPKAIQVNPEVVRIYLGEEECSGS